jgi:hypothetical protein
MSDPAHPTVPDQPIYRLRVQSHLAPHGAAWFDGMAVTAHADGTTTLEGPVVDSAALYGLISRLRDLGLTLLAVQQVADGDRS